MTADMQLAMSFTQSKCAVIAGDPIHARDRAAVIAAVRQAAAHGGLISANDWRPFLEPWIYPKVIGATVNGLIQRKVLVAEGPPVRSDDVKGGNAGRWIPQYRYNGDRL